MGMAVTAGWTTSKALLAAILPLVADLAPPQADEADLGEFIQVRQVRIAWHWPVNAHATHAAMRAATRSSSSSRLQAATGCRCGAVDEQQQQQQQQ
ncbi:hypothetical protein HaLaN_23279, partial [Haematococcus lacustris]